MIRLAWLVPVLLLAAPARATAPSFGDPVDIVVGHNQAGFDIAATDSALFVAWVNYDGTTAHDLWFTSITHAGVPLVTRSLMRAETLSLDPAIAVEGDVVGIAWVENDHDHPGVSDTLFFQRSTDGGVTWKPRQDLDIPSLGFQEAAPRLLAYDGHLYLAYQQFGDIMLLRSNNLGVTWLPAVTLAHEDDTDVEQASLYADASGLFATYLNAGRIAVQRSGDGGDSWDAPLLLTDGTAATWRPDIAGDGSRIIVTWWQRQKNLKPGNGRVLARVSTDHAASFKPVRRVSGPIPASGFGPPQITAALGRFTIAWQDRDSGLRLAFSARGLAWLDRMKLPATTFLHGVAGTAAHLWVVYDVGTDDIQGVHAPE